MARPLRLEFPGALWHVTSRGNERREVVRDNADRIALLEQISDSAHTFHWRIFAYVLMTNHYHLLLETPDKSLSRGMRQLNGRYAQEFNRRHHRVGHLFQGRFNAILVERESHFVELCRYIVLNPVRAAIVRTARDWQWSSYRATAGFEMAPRWLDVDSLLKEFDPFLPQKARQLYRRFVAAGGSYHPWSEIADQIYLGSREFRERVAPLIDLPSLEHEYPRRQLRPERKRLEDVIAAVVELRGSSLDCIIRARRCAERAMICWLGRHESLATLNELGAILDRTDSGVSRLIQYAEEKITRDDAFRQSIERILARLRSEEVSGRMWRMET